MPPYDPDPAQPATPRTTWLRSRQTIWRVYSKGLAPAAFNPGIRAQHPPGGLVLGGRFDATAADPFEYLYAGSDTVAAAAETIFRDRPPTQQPFIVPALKLRGLSLSRLRVTGDLHLTKLHGDGLFAIGQDAWLTACGAGEYARTRRWAAAVRRWHSAGCGLVWRPRHDNSRFSYVFFGDRCPPGTLVADGTYPVDTPGRGFSLMQRAAAKHNAVVSLP